MAIHSQHIHLNLKNNFENLTKKTKDMWIYVKNIKVAKNLLRSGLDAMDV